MWKILQIKPSYFINVSIYPTYQVFITDYTRIWSVAYSEGLFIDCLKESNIGLEIDDNELLNCANEMLIKPEKLQSLCISQDMSGLKVSMTMNFGYPLNIEMKLKEGDNKLYFNKITQPLLRTIHDLKESEDELRTLLIKKDEEIVEYKSQGGKIKYTALPTYKDAEHMSKHSSFVKIFGENQFPDTVLEETMNDVAESLVKHETVVENQTVKTESLSNAEDLSVTITETIKEEAVQVEFKPFVPKKKIKRLNI